MIAALYKTKKLLKESVGSPLRYQETSMMGTEYKSNGTFPVVGPSAYQRVWYAQVTITNGLVKSVK